jgi:GNAT superfamily N-acetyltransferase
LAYCDGFGCVRGVALFDYREDKLLVTVDPSHRRRGIATELMQEAVKRWPIDFEKQGYTEDGAKFFRKFLNSGK